MHKIDNNTAVNQQFVDGDPLRGVIATRLTASWLNAVQNEIANVILLTGLALNKSSDRQLYDAIKKIAVDTPLASHTHEIAGVSGLAVALDGKAASNHHHDTAYAAAGHNHSNDYAPKSHTHTINQIDGLQQALDSKAASNHNHDNAYAAAGHNHSNDYAPKTHGHTINQIDGLQSALDDKSPNSHGHHLEIIGDKIRIVAGAIPAATNAWQTLPTSLGGTGPKGDTGLQGPKGDTGLQGPKGDTGLQGPKGDTGPAGADGSATNHDHDDRYVQINTGSQQKGAVPFCKNTSAALSGGEMVSGAKLFPACVAMDGTVTAQSGSLPGTWVAKGFCLLNHCANFERVL